MTSCPFSHLLFKRKLTTRVRENILVLNTKLNQHQTMLTLLLQLAKLFFREPCSVQREILTRLQKKRGAWDADNEELLEIYEHLQSIVKKRTGVGTISTGEFMSLIKHPTSTLNFFYDRKVPFNDLQKFRTQFINRTP